MNDILKNNKFYNRLMKILVTGAARFIGYHLILSILDRDDEVIGVDNLNR